MPKQTLTPDNLGFQPRPIYPYSPGTMAKGFIFTSGQVAWDASGKIVGVGDIHAQTRRTLSNVLSVLAKGGAKPTDVVKCNVYLSDMRNFQAMNEEYRKVFPTDPPSRTTVEARLAEPEMLVEIEAVAFVG